jgi:hypothetical protein
LLLEQAAGNKNATQKGIEPASIVGLKLLNQVNNHLTWNLGLDGVDLHVMETSGTLSDYSNTIKRIRSGQYVGGEDVTLDRFPRHHLLLLA